MATEKTPENTPLPGGGSWHWDSALGDWAENPPYGSKPASTAVAAPADPAPLLPPTEITPE